MASTSVTLQEGIVLLRRGQLKKARGCFARATEADPNNPIGVSYLGLAVALAERDYGRAEDLCFRAVLLGMEKGQIHANLAWVYHLQGKRRSTIQSIADALDRDPRNRDALRIRGLIGQRQTPPLHFLARAHPVNKAIGKALHRMKNGR